MSGTSAAVAAVLVAVAPPLPKPSVAIVWASWCAPCSAELRALPRYTTAAGVTRMMVLSLDPPAVARSRLAALGVAPEQVTYAPGAAADTLGAISEGAPRLPLAIALDRRGGLCGRHHGLLGTDLVREWARTCSK